MRKLIGILSVAMLAGCSSPSDEKKTNEEKNSTKYQFDLTKERAWLNSEDRKKCLIEEEKYKKDYQAYLKAVARFEKETEAAKAKQAAADKAYAEYEAKQKEWKTGDELLEIPKKFVVLPLHPMLPKLVICTLAPDGWTPEN